MKKMLMLPALAILLGAATLPAAGDPSSEGIELQILAEVMTVVTGDDGIPTEKLLPAGKIVPGDEVTFTLIYHHRGDLPAEDVFITNPIPGHMAFQSAGALPAGLEISYSIDGGENFHPPALLAVKGPDAKTRSAAPADYTHIRWTFARPLAPGEQGQVRYTARLL